MADRYDALTPTNLIATLRSFERRYGAVTGPMRSDPELLARADAPGPDGDSMVDLCNRALRAVSMLGAEAERIATHVDPVSPAAAFDPETWADGSAPVATMAEATDVIASTANQLADRLDGLQSDEWNRTTTITGGGSMSLIDVVRAIAREGVETLRRAERQLEWLQS
ncbi:MAG: hypothetical protein R2710_30325 [Acidimicrobiales bacterium]